MSKQKKNNKTTDDVVDDQNDDLADFVDEDEQTDSLTYDLNYDNNNLRNVGDNRDTQTTKLDIDIDDDDIDDLDEIDEDNKVVKKSMDDRKHSEIVDSIKNGYKKRIILIRPENNITSDKLTKYEKTELIGIRAAIIEKDPTIFVNSSSSALDIAERELNERKFPLYLRRLIKTYIDNNSKSIIEEYEIIDPNLCLH